MSKPAQTISQDAAAKAFFRKLIIATIGLWVTAPYWMWLWRRLVPHAENENVGVFGDQFGAINSLFTGVAFLGLFYTILQQQQMLRAQQEEMHRAEHDHKTEVGVSTLTAILTALPVLIGEEEKRLEYLTAEDHEQPQFRIDWIRKASLDDLGNRLVGLRMREHEIQEQIAVLEKTFEDRKATYYKNENLPDQSARLPDPHKDVNMLEGEDLCMTLEDQMQFALRKYNGASARAALCRKIADTLARYISLKTQLRDCHARLMDIQNQVSPGSTVITSTAP